AEKLEDLNAHYIRESGTPDLVRDLLPFLNRLGLEDLDEGRVAKAVETLKPRSRTMADMAQQAAFYFQEEIVYEEQGDRKFLKGNVLELMEDIAGRLRNMMDFSRAGLEKIFAAFLEEKQIKLGKIAQPIRVALTGRTASPGLFEVMEVLGRDRVLSRLDRAVDHIRSKTQG
ncbi:MAG: glutamate--tRNA ligase, partial [Deltaproteobacteria bacterium]|nr:glutamate--tRNA ligase [Deltaproteobacteria bacterium]